MKRRGLLCSSSLSLLWWLTLLLLFIIANDWGYCCEANNTNDNGDDTSSSSYCDSRGRRRVVVRQVGTKLNDEARFPITFEGNWEKVIAAPEVLIIADTNDVIFTEGPLVRHRRNDSSSDDNYTDESSSSSSSTVLYVSDTVRAVIYRISSSSSSSERNNYHEQHYYNMEIWATHSGGIDNDEDDEVNKNLAEKGSNGMATDSIDPEFVIINQHGLRRVIRCRLDDHTQGAPLRDCPDFTVVTDSFPTFVDPHEMNTNNNNNEKSSSEQLLFQKYNSPNDVVVHPRDGSIWFTDPIYGLLENDRFCDEFSCGGGGESYLDKKSDIGWQGVYRIGRTNRNNNNKDTTTTYYYTSELVTKYHRRPNGLAFTPDAKHLWVADSTIGSPSWTAYDVIKMENHHQEEEEEGKTCPSFSISSKATNVVTPATLGTILGRTENLPPFFTGGEGLSDGFKFDEQGYLWTSIPNGYAVIDTTKHEVICQILLGVNTSNLAFGTNGDVWLTGKAGIWKIKRRS